MANLSDKVDSIERIHRVFQLERICYIVLTLLSVITIIALALYLVFENESNIKYVMSLFAPAGIISLSIRQLLVMYDKAFKFLANSKSHE